jgi:hypothetical protein
MPNPIPLKQQGLGKGEKSKKEKKKRKKAKKKAKKEKKSDGKSWFSELMDYLGPVVKEAGSTIVKYLPLLFGKARSPGRQVAITRVRASLKGTTHLSSRRLGSVMAETAPLATAYDIEASPPPLIHYEMGRDTYYIGHTEVLERVTVTDTTKSGDLLFRTSISPDIASWIRVMSHFERYRPVLVSITYIPFSSATTEGGIAGTYEWDHSNLIPVGNGDTTFRNIMAHAGASATRPWTEHTWVFQPEMLGDWYYRHTNGIDSNLRIAGDFTLVAGTDFDTAGQLGILEVAYLFEFKTPELMETPSGYQNMYWGAADEPVVKVGIDSPLTFIESYATDFSGPTYVLPMGDIFDVYGAYTPTVDWKPGATDGYVWFTANPGYYDLTILLDGGSGALEDPALTPRGSGNLVGQLMAEGLQDPQAVTFHSGTTKRILSYIIKSVRRCVFPAGNPSIEDDYFEFASGFNALTSCNVRLTKIGNLPSYGETESEAIEIMKEMARNYFGKSAKLIKSKSSGQSSIKCDLEKKPLADEHSSTGAQSGVLSVNCYKKLIHALPIN